MNKQMVMFDLPQVEPPVGGKRAPMLPGAITVNGMHLEWDAQHYVVTDPAGTVVRNVPRSIGPRFLSKWIKATMAATANATQLHLNLEMGHTPGQV